MSTHVIILAQGEQRRLPALRIPKQLLRLPACAKAPDDPTPIIARTLTQIAMLSPVVESEGIAYCDKVSVTVVCAGALYDELDIWAKSSVWNTCKRVLSVAPISLKDPGNSSLKGIKRFLRDQCMDDDTLPHPPNETTIVLLGDVVYSWETLHACMIATHWGMTFVGTPDLSRSGESMMTCLDAALAKHPPFSEYQPGQMRRWLWEMDAFIDVNPTAAKIAGLARTWFKTSSPDDYTRDIDLPEHVAELEALSIKAAADDARHGLRWKR